MRDLWPTLTKDIYLVTLRFMRVLERPSFGRRGRAMVAMVVASASVVTMQNGCGGKDEGSPYGDDRDGDGWPSDFDCDDEDEDVFPNADEIPGDGVDQDCSG